MSASSKKKLRNAQQAEKLSEKQRAEQREAKKLKLYTTLAVVILIALVSFAAYIGISKTFVNSGILERSTTALTIGDEKISNAELSYFFVDAVNNFNNQYGSYAYILGLYPGIPLDEQVYNPETGETWADNFLATAIENAKATYALVNAAKAEGYTLPDEAVASITQNMSTISAYAMIYGYTNVDTYLKTMYGPGATEKGLREYLELTMLASYYQNYYYDSLVYSDDQLRAAEADNYNKYSSYNFNYYYLSTSSFIVGEQGENGYTDEQLSAAEKSAEVTAKSLTDGITTVEEFDAAIAALPINAESATAVSTASKDVAYGSVYSAYAEWVTNPARKAGDMTYVPNIAVSTDEEGNEVEKINGYYVLMFNSCDDNAFPLANVRHILVAFQGGTADPTTGMTVYSDEEKAAAKATAEELYAQWQNGEATEDSFAALANEKSDDGDGTTGGLYTDIYPGQMVSAFENWCFGGHKPGDTGIVETEYGYHIMFYSADSETTYRDLLISNDLATTDYNTWYTDLVAGVTATRGNTKYVCTNMVLSS